MWYNTTFRPLWLIHGVFTCDNVVAQNHKALQTRAKARKNRKRR